MILCLSILALSGSAGILKKKIPDKLVVLTFDDATASQYSVVAPMLREFGFGATFFICEFPPNFADTAKYMNWRQIKVLDKMGFEIANHTRSHPKITRLSDSEFDSELGYIDKKCDSSRIAKPRSFAYPGYDLNLKVLQSLQQKGYLFARAGGGRPYDPQMDHPLLIPSWAMNEGNKQLMMDAFQQARNGKIVVITIHGVPDIEHPWVNTPPELFREYLQYLSVNGYKVLSLRDLKKYINVYKALKEITPDFTKKLKN